MGFLTGAEMLCDLKNVKGYRDHRGKWRYYFRKKGCPAIALKAEPGSDEFLASYQAAKETVMGPATPMERSSFEALCRDYQASAEFSGLAKSTKREMGYVIAELCREHGHKPVGRLQRKHILDMKAKLKTKPGACNKMLRTVKTILGYGVLAEYRGDNPAEKIKLMKVGRHRAWTDGELKQYEGRWPLGTLERMIFDLALYTGQRRADLATIRRDQAAAGVISIRQSKTDAPVTIPVHRTLRASLMAFLSTHKAETVIAGPAGETLHPVSMAAIFRAARNEAGLPVECVLHGLRKTFCRIMAELNHPSYPVTGHRTRAMQEEYERDASQAKMATAAIISWEKASKKKRA